MRHSHSIGEIICASSFKIFGFSSSGPAAFDDGSRFDSNFEIPWFVMLISGMIGFFVLFPCSFVLTIFELIQCLVLRRLTEIIDLVQRLSVWCPLLICPPVLVMLYYCSQYSYFLCKTKICSCYLKCSHLYLVLLSFLYISSMIGVWFLYLVFYLLIFVSLIFAARFFHCFI